MNPFSLEGKAILVTGASSGIGKAIAIECSKMRATIILTARNEERLQKTMSRLHGRGHRCISAELTDEASLDDLVGQLGVLDGVVLCAGKAMTLPFQFNTNEKVKDIFEVNFFAQVNLLRLLYKKKLVKKEGSIVIISSIAGNYDISIGHSAYGASKAAINSVMKYCAKEFAARKIRVNSICPGMVETPLIHRGTVSAEQLEKDKANYLLKRYGQPEDIAYAAIYLLSNASSWVTGQDLKVDGGVNLN
ncbi:SDR family NAD(P)-dependent oxidoreductase [Butyricimonas virosa]|jgi:3-oxoacyl-[acyl-carrier-protein] reductase|uniref:SDR family NAD(P)-dependent oxidoreductase n=1 Tax=Butyricimonas virosa TaxID=544645 RepID=UPI0032C0F2F3